MKKVLSKFTHDFSKKDKTQAQVKARDSQTSTPSANVTEDVDNSPGGVPGSIIGLQDEFRSHRSKVQEDFMVAVEELKKTCAKVSQSRSGFLAEHDFQSLVERMQEENNLNDNAQIIRTEITEVIRAKSRSDELSKKNVLPRIGNFLTKLIPVAKLSLGLASTVGEDFGFAPVKYVANGLGLILQLLEQEVARPDDFYEYLERIEFEASRVEDTHINSLSDTLAKMVREKATVLMTGIAVFLNCTLIYLSSNFAVNLAKTVVGKAAVYEDGKRKLTTAIEIYNQALLDLAVNILAVNKANQDITEKKTQDEKFRKWLSPSTWFVEAQFHSFTLQREDSTLQWAVNMTEFTQWHTSLKNSNDRILWIRGGPGVGKSTLSAYLITILKHLYPTATVVYFFCKSGQPGLTRATDIIRTLAYQCSEENTTAQSILVDLQNQDFPVDKQLGVQYMSQKLLTPTLNAISKDVYLVLDGLDEMDMVKDTPGRKLEMNVLMETLAHFCSTTSMRLMVVSRPQTDLQQIIPKLLVRTISSTDNTDDIQRYVEEKVENSVKLKKSFQNAEVQSSEYFRVHAKGMFLWVSLVLEELVKIRSKAAFKQCLNRFATTAGNLTKLYVEILNRIAEADRVWVKEIIGWVFICQGSLSVKELKAVVEFAVGDEMDEFDRFLEVQCGSFLRFIRDRRKSVVVEFVHETFRSFVTDAEVCPSEFLVEEQSTHEYATITCLQLACANEDLPNKDFQHYAFGRWTDHLRQASHTSHSVNDILRQLYRLFDTEALDRWIISEFLDEGRHPFGTPIPLGAEEEELDVILNWLQKSAAKGRATESLDDLVFKEAVGWRAEVLTNPNTLSQAIGKAAARIWMHGNVDDFEDNRSSLLLALQHYLKRNNHPNGQRDELRELTASNFAGLIQWADLTGIQPKQSQFAIAFELLGQKHKALVCYQAIDSNTDELDLWIGRAGAYSAVGNHREAVETYLAALDKFPNEQEIYLLLGDAYTRLGKYKEAQEAYWNALKEGPLPAIGWFGGALVVMAFQAAGDHDGLLRFYESALEMGVPNVPFFDWYLTITQIWRFFRATCEASGDYPRIITRCQHEIAKGHVYFHSILVDVYKEIGQFDKAIEEHDSYSTDSDSLIPAQIYADNGDFGKAIELAQGAYEREYEDSNDSTRLLGSFLVQEGNYPSMITFFNKAAQEHSSEPLIWSRLAESYMWNGEYDKAIDVTHKALSIEGNGQEKELWFNLGGAFEAKLEYAAAFEAYSKGLERPSNREKKCSDRFTFFCFSHDLVDELIQLCQLWLISDPIDMRTWSCLYSACKRKDNVGIFETIFQDWLKNVPDIGKLCSGVASLWAEDMMWDDAIRVHEIGVEKRPEGNVGNDYYLTKSVYTVYTGKKNYDKAIEVVKKASQERPFGDKWSIVLGDLFFKKGDFKEAIESYNAAIEESPTDVEGWAGLGEVYYTQGDHQKAMEIYQTGGGKVEYPLQLCHKMGLLYVEQGQWQKAIAAYRAVVGSGSFETPEIWNQFRDIYSSVGHDAGILLEYSLAIIDEEFSQPSTLWTSFHEEGMRQGEYGILILLYEETLDQNPYRYQQWSQLGDAYRASCQYGLAINSYQRATQLRPTIPEFWEGVCRTLEEEGDLPRAMEMCEMAIQRNPAVLWLRKRLSNQYNLSGRPEDAFRITQSAVRQFPTSTLLRDTLGRLYAENGQYEKAMDILKEGIEQNPTGSWLRFGMGDVHNKMGNSEAAATEYQKALEGYDEQFMFCLVDSLLAHRELDSNSKDDIVSAFPWRRLCAVSNKSDAAKIYDAAILTYTTALAKESESKNELLCIYKYGLPFDTFDRTELSEKYLWTALGEAYRGRGDNIKAAEAYEKAIGIAGVDKDWLCNRLAETQKQVRGSQ